VVSLLKKLRVSAGISIEEAAKKLCISAGYLSQIENGKRRVSVQRAEEIAKLYGVSKDEIFLPARYSIRVVSKMPKASGYDTK